MWLIAIYLVLAVIGRGCSDGLTTRVFEDALIEYNYENLLNSSVIHIFEFHLNHSLTYEVTSSATSKADSSVVFFTFVNDRGQEWWNIPYFGSQTLTRPLCAGLYSGTSSKMRVYVSSFSNRTINYGLFIKPTDIMIEYNFETSAELSYYRPIVFKFNNTEADVELILELSSNDSRMCQVSIQALKCPVFDIDKIEKKRGRYHTMTTFGALTIHDHWNSSYLVITMPPSENGAANEFKHLNISIKHKIDQFNTLTAITIPFIFYVFICCLIFVWFYYQHSMINCEIEEVIKRCTDHKILIDSYPIKCKEFVTVADLSSLEDVYLHKKFNVYGQLTATIALFYVIPVAQLVFQYQTELSVTGDEDMCYFNFLCIRRLGFVTAFNNIFSNIGYCLLGLLFLFIVSYRDAQYQRLKARYPQWMKRHGLPQHFGLYYSMGIGLIVQGIMSACYHVCPSRRNFQFDTTFMYITAILNILKIYEARHPDINPHAYVTFSFLAIVILSVVFGSYVPVDGLWHYMAIAHIYVCLLMGAKVYYMGRLKINFQMTYQVSQLLMENGLFSLPRHPFRLLFTLLAFLANAICAIHSIKYPPPTLADYLVFICLGNLVLYFVWYIVMKFHYREPFSNAAVICISITFILWPIAFFYFDKRVKDWEVSPAQSRQYNEHCRLLKYYDAHDIWHFVSAMALYFSFMSVLTIDDKIRVKRRDHIPAF